MPTWDITAQLTRRAAVLLAANISGAQPALGIAVREEHPHPIDRARDKEPLATVVVTRADGRRSSYRTRYRAYIDGLIPHV